MKFCLSILFFVLVVFNKGSDDLESSVPTVRQLVKKYYKKLKQRAKSRVFNKGSDDLETSVSTVRQQVKKYFKKLKQHLRAAAETKVSNQGSHHQGGHGAFMEQQWCTGQMGSLTEAQKCSSQCEPHNRAFCHGHEWRGFSEISTNARCRMYYRPPRGAQGYKHNLPLCFQDCTSDSACEYVSVYSGGNTCIFSRKGYCDSKFPATGASVWRKNGASDSDEEEVSSEAAKSFISGPFINKITKAFAGAPCPAKKRFIRLFTGYMINTACKLMKNGRPGKCQKAAATHANGICSSIDGHGPEVLAGCQMLAKVYPKFGCQKRVCELSVNVATNLIVKLDKKCGKSDRSRD